ncbi:MAG TPA: hypothetical protein VIR03_00555 [Candidatus Saccharimonadales bacterium]
MYRYRPEEYGSQPEDYLPPSSSADARARRGRAAVLGGLATGFFAIGGLTWAAISSGESTPNASPAPSTSAKPFTPTPETTTVAASPSMTESALPSNASPTTEATVVPTTDSVTRLQAAADILDKSGCYAGGSTYDGRIIVKGKKVDQLNLDIVTDGINPESNVPGIKRELGVVILDLDSNGMPTGKIFTDNVPTGNPGLTRAHIPASAPGEPLQVAVVARATNLQTGEVITSTTACTGPAATLDSDGKGGFDTSKVQFGGLDRNGSLFSSVPVDAYPNAHLVPIG